MTRDKFTELLSCYTGVVKYAENCSIWDYYDAVEICDAYYQDVLTTFDMLQAENAAYREVLEVYACPENWRHEYTDSDDPLLDWDESIDWELARDVLAKWRINDEQG